MKRAVIMGATSGMGMAVSRILAEKGWRLGIAGRREEKLKELQALFPDRISYQVIDIEKDDAPVNLQVLIEKIGGMDLYFHGSGVGWHNEELDLSTELKTVSTNALGFTRMVDSAWHYFCQRGGGHIAVISSIAGVKGLGPAPSYSATKGFDNTYIQALAQLSQEASWNHFHRYPAGICRHSSAGYFKASLSDAHAAPEGFQDDCEGHREKKEGGCHRLALPRSCFLLEAFAELDMGTDQVIAPRF